MRAHALSLDGRENQQRIRQELLDDNWWATMPIRDVLPEVKLYCDLFQQGLSLAQPAAGAATALKDPERVYQFLKAGSILVTLVRDGAEAAGTESVLELAGSSATPLATLKSLHDYKETAEKRAEMKATVQEQVNRLDAAIARYDARLESIASDISQFAAINQAINQFCSETKLQPAHQQSPE